MQSTFLEQIRQPEFALDSKLEIIHTRDHQIVVKKKKLSCMFSQGFQLFKFVLSKDTLKFGNWKTCHPKNQCNRTSLNS